MIRDDCPPPPSIAKSAPLVGLTLRIAIAGNDMPDLRLARIVASAVAALGGRATFVSSRAATGHGRGSAAIGDGSVDAEIVRASPTLPHPAGWLAPAGTVDDLIDREVVADQAGPLTGSSRRWAALETRAVQRAVDIPLAVGRTAVLVGPSIQRSSVLLHPVLGLDLTALAAR